MAKPAPNFNRTPNTKGDDGTSTELPDLHEAARENDVRKMIVALVETPIDTLEESTGMTAFHYAAGYGCVEAVQLLMRRGADPLILDKSERTPAMILGDAHPGRYNELKKEIFNYTFSNPMEGKKADPTLEGAKKSSGFVVVQKESSTEPAPATEDEESLRDQQEFDRTTENALHQDKEKTQPPEPKDRRPPMDGTAPKTDTSLDPTPDLTIRGTPRKYRPKSATKKPGVKLGGLVTPELRDCFAKCVAHQGVTQSAVVEKLVVDYLAEQGWDCE